MLELVDVTVGYSSSSQVLDHVSVEVPSGACVALLGPNGAGKTTLLRAATRMLALQTGAVRLDGRDVSRMSSHQVSALGICHVPEGRGIFPALSVRDNLALFARTTSPTAAVQTAVEAFPFIERRIDALAGTLSGGERQMLALTRTLLCAPRVVLLDEVSMGLAPIVVDEVYAFIARLVATGVSLLIVEQYVERVLRVADHVHLMRNGSIRWSGTPHDLTSEEDILGHYLGAALDEHIDGVPATARDR